MIIDIIDETESLTNEQLQLVENLLQFAAKEENVEEEAEVSVTFVTDATIQEINKTYRNKDAVTDVISFALEEETEGELAIQGIQLPRVLGDIIISVPRAKEQAREYNHSFDRELGFLTVHGFLHLLGYDHMNEGDEKKMFDRQKNILEQYGLKR